MRRIITIAICSFLAVFVGLPALQSAPGGNGSRLKPASLDVDTAGCPTTFQAPTCDLETHWTVGQSVTPAGDLQDPDATPFGFQIDVTEGATSRALTAEGSFWVTNDGETEARLSSIVANLQTMQEVPNPSGSGTQLKYVTVASSIQVESDACRALNVARTCMGEATEMPGAGLVLIDPFSNDLIALADVLPIPPSRPDDPLTPDNESCNDAVLIGFRATFDLDMLAVNTGDDSRIEVLATFASAGRRGKSSASCTVDADCDGSINSDDPATTMVDESEQKNVRTIAQRMVYPIPACTERCQEVTLDDPGAISADTVCTDVDNATQAYQTIYATGVDGTTTSIAVGGDATCVGSACGTALTNEATITGPGCEGLIDGDLVGASLDVACNGAPPPIVSGDFCSFPARNWRLDCPPNADELPPGHPGCVRDDYFDTVFPGGAAIGEGPLDGPPFFTALWTSSETAQDFLQIDYPPPSTLTADLVDPLTTSAGFLAGRALALTFSVEFSCSGVFDALGVEHDTNYCLGDLVICQETPATPFQGMTVRELLDLANRVVSGDVYALAPYNTTLLRLTNQIAEINFNFAGCVWNQGRLCRP